MVATVFVFFFVLVLTIIVMVTPFVVPVLVLLLMLVPVRVVALCCCACAWACVFVLFSLVRVICSRDVFCLFVCRLMLFFFSFWESGGKAGRSSGGAVEDAKGRHKAERGFLPLRDISVF